MASTLKQDELLPAVATAVQQGAASSTAAAPVPTRRRSSRGGVVSSLGSASTTTTVVNSAQLMQHCPDTRVPSSHMCLDTLVHDSSGGEGGAGTAHAQQETPRAHHQGRVARERATATRLGELHAKAPSVYEQQQQHQRVAKRQRQQH